MYGLFKAEERTAADDDVGAPTHACMHANGGVAPLSCVLHHALAPNPLPSSARCNSPSGELFELRTERLAFVRMRDAQ